MTINIQRVLIWQPWLRVAHWLLAFSVVLLAMTGWLMQMAPSMAIAASEYHYLLASVLTVGLLLRIWLLFSDKGTGHWSKLIPEVKDRRTIKKMLLFYASFGKRPQPKWYAHNPLWKLVYVFVFILLLLLILTGAAREDFPVMFGFFLPDIHGFLATTILVFVILHIIAVVLHDYKGDASDVSSMINGHRIFVADKQSEFPSDLKEQPITFKPIKKKSD
ncbi:MAG: cytochrome b/b6 domain-containing protein [Granulosicoccus sp.]